MRKICSRCKIEKSYPEEFGSNALQCKACYAERSRVWRVNNKDKYRESQKKECQRRKKLRVGRINAIIDRNLFKHKEDYWRKRNRLKNILWITEYFKSNPCVDCGETDPLVLEFDHVRDKKSFNIGQKAHTGLTLEKIKKEVKKCEVRCANCHSRKTAKERKFLSYKILHEDFILSEEGKALIKEPEFIRINPNSSD